MARRKHQPAEPIQATTPPVRPMFETEADAEAFIVECVRNLQDSRPPGEKGQAVSKSMLLRAIAVQHAGIDLDSLDRYLVNLLSDGRLGVTAGRWWVRRKAPPVLVLGLLVLLLGCGSNFSTANPDVGTGGAALGSAGAPPAGTGGAALGSAGAPPAGTGGAALGSAGAPPAGTGGAALGSAGAPAAGTGGAALGSAGAASAGGLVTAGSPGLPTGGTAGSGVRWPACLSEGCGSSCRTLVGPGWCEVMARCLDDNDCVASSQPNCTGCSALPDGIDCECAP
jgi:hypothetical protein